MTITATIFNQFFTVFTTFEHFSPFSDSLNCKLCVAVKQCPEHVHRHEQCYRLKAERWCKSCKSNLGTIKLRARKHHAWSVMHVYDSRPHTWIPRTPENRCGTSATMFVRLPRYKHPCLPLPSRQGVFQEFPFENTSFKEGVKPLRKQGERNCRPGQEHNTLRVCVSPAIISSWVSLGLEAVVYRRGRFHSCFSSPSTSEPSAKNLV